MKLNLLLLVLFGCSLFCRAQVPQAFSFQGVARKADGKEVTNAQIGVRVSILTGSVVGAAVYQEIHSVQTTSRGVFDIRIGGGNAQLGDFTSIEWSEGKYFIKIELDVDGGSNYVNAGASQLLSVPYAMHAKTANSWLHNQPVIQTGTFQSGDVLGTPGDGARLIWYPRKAAFASGYTAGGTWDNANIGEYSAAFGNQSRAKGSGGFAFGAFSIADGQFAFAGGDKSTALGNGSVALGLGTTSRAVGSVALGAFNDTQDSPVAGGAGQPLDRVFQIGNGSGPLQTSNAFTVLRNGNVGVGQGAINPAFPLDVEGRMRLRHTTNSTAGIFLNNSQNVLSGFVGMINDQKLGFYIGNKWRFQVADNGNVGIGESVIDPEFTLDLGGRPRIRHTPNATAGIHLDNSLNIPSGFMGMINDDKVGFFIGNKWRFQVKGNGNVGIGDNVIDPLFLLDVGGRARIRHNLNSTAGVLLDNSQNNPDAFMGMINDEKVGFYIGNKWRFQVRSNGNVGVGEGVIDPEYALDIGGRPRIRHQGNWTAGIYFNDSQNTPVGFVGMAADNQLGLYTGGAWRFWVDNAGNSFVKGKLGIGNSTFNPERALDVDGTVRLRHKPGRPAGIYFDAAKTIAFQEVGVIDTAMAIVMQPQGPIMDFKVRGNSDDYFVPLSVSGNGIWAYQATVQGVVVAGGYITQSDRRMKRDITLLSESIDKLSRLNGYSYYWKDKPDQTMQTGVIAQEVEEVFPELVHTDTEGVKSVNYTGLIPHLIESIKLLRSENQALDKANSELGSRLLLVEQGLKAIEAINVLKKH